MSKPQVSILMATYNRAHLLDRSIGSALVQDFTNWEMIVVDDGVDRATEKRMMEWEKKDRRIRYFRIPHRGRIAPVSNFGLDKARGDYVAILDDDDYWALPDKLTRQVRFLDKNKDCVGCGGGFIVIDERGKETFRVMKPEQDRDIKKNVLLANPMANTTTLFRRATAEAVGRYDETMTQFADWDFWLKMGLRGTLYNFQEYFAYYQMWDEGRSFRNQRENARSALRIVYRYKDKYSGFGRAASMAYLYVLYASFPVFIRNFLNPLLSRAKKALFGARRVSHNDSPG